MQTCVFEFQKHFSIGAVTRRMGQLMNLFGITLRRLENLSSYHALDLRLEPGEICYITGASGSGKSVLIREMINRVPPEHHVNLEDIPLVSTQSVIDTIDGDLFDAVGILGRAGLTDALAMLQTPALLSTGQQFRYRLAMALLSKKPVIFADEFMSSVDTLSAAVICRQLRNIAAKTRRIFIFGGVHDYVIPDLMPDVVVIKSITQPTRIVRNNPAQKEKH